MIRTKEEEILKKIRKDYKPLSDKSRLTINNINANKTELNIRFSVEAKTIIDNITHFNLDDIDIFYRLHTEQLLSLIEKNLYEILPVFNIKPTACLNEANTKIRIDTHIPDGVILMSPKTYAEHLSFQEEFCFPRR